MLIHNLRGGPRLRGPGGGGTPPIDAAWPSRGKSVIVFGTMPVLTLLKRPRSAVKRAALALLTAVYGLCASQAPYLALDLLQPRFKAASAAGFACAGHACGCRTEEQCRTRCCCAGGHDSAVRGGPPDGGARRAARVVHVASLAEARCAGTDPAPGAGGVSTLAPHLPPPGLALPRTTSTAVFPPDRPAQAGSPPRDPPDKVPV